MKSTKPILLIEDNRADEMSLKRALKDLKVTNTLDVTGNGEEALEFLNEPKSELPCVIFLDINMPRMNGIEFLRIIKQDDRLKIIPVVVLTSFKEDQDKLDSFGLGIAGYMQKPVDYCKFIEAIRTINLYWTLSELA
ncbi:MAG: response regulator [Thermodesulfobacteriota bacterium]|nr:response regulator [Thermodesulfobacteriota bacterium]